MLAHLGFVGDGLNPTQAAIARAVVSTTLSFGPELNTEERAALVGRLTDPSAAWNLAS